MSEDPVGHLYTLLPSGFVRGSEMDAVVNTDTDHIGRHVRETVISAGLLHGLRVVARGCEGHVVLPKEQCERAG